MPTSLFSSAIAATLTIVAPEIELRDYTVKEGDTCTSIAKNELGGRNNYKVLHEHNPSMGPTPHHLEAGTVLKLPREKEAPTGPDATVTAAYRQVEARSPKDEAWSAASQGFDLFRGWRINTLERAFAEVTFVDKSRIQLRENTLVIIYGGTDAAARRSSNRAQLDRGALRSRLGELAGEPPLTIETPSANATIGGPAVVAVDDAGAARLSNHSKSPATVTSRDAKAKPVKVPSLTGSKVERGKDPTPPKPLPPTPSWNAGSPTTFVVIDGGLGSIAGQWKPVAKAASYRVEIGKVEQGGFVMTSVTVPGTVDRFEAHNLQAGQYFATVAAVDDDSFESPPSGLHNAELVPATLLGPDGKVLAPPATAEGASPTTAPSRLEVLPGSTMTSPPGLECAALDGVPPSKSVTFIEPGPAQVRCVGATGTGAPGFPVTVATVAVAPASDAGFSVVRGTPQAVTFQLDSSLELPEGLAIRSEAGVDAGVLTRAPDGTYTVELTAGPQAAASTQLAVVVASDGKAAPDSPQLTSFTLTVTETSPPPAEPAPKPVNSERHMVELGVFGGFIRPSANHELVTTDAPLARNRQLNATAPEIGLRLGYYPLRSFGFEIEGGLMPTKLREGSKATLYEIRGHIIGQLPYRVTPYLLVGGGVLGLTSAKDVLGDDVDASFHFGGGVKFFATKYLAIRLGIRDVTLPTTRSTGGANSLQLLFGVSGVFRRESAKAR